MDYDRNEASARNLAAAHELNVDAAQRELDRRNAEGEDVSNLRVDPRTARIVEAPKRQPKATAKVVVYAGTSGPRTNPYGKEYPPPIRQCLTVEIASLRADDIRSAARAAFRAGPNGAEVIRWIDIA